MAKSSSWNHQGWYNGKPGALLQKGQRMAGTGGAEALQSSYISTTAVGFEQPPKYA